MIYRARASEVQAGRRHKKMWTYPLHFMVLQPGMSSPPLYPLSNCHAFFMTQYKCLPRKLLWFLRKQNFLHCPTTLPSNIYTLHCHHLIIYLSPQPGWGLLQASEIPSSHQGSWPQRQCAKKVCWMNEWMATYYAFMCLSTTLRCFAYWKCTKKYSQRNEDLRSAGKERNNLGFLSLRSLQSDHLSVDHRNICRWDKEIKCMSR